MPFSCSHSACPRPHPQFPFDLQESRWKALGALCAFNGEPERQQPNAHAVGAEGTLAVEAEDSDQSLGAGVGVPPAPPLPPPLPDPAILPVPAGCAASKLFYAPPAIPEATTRAEGSAASWMPVLNDVAIPIEDLHEIHGDGKARCRIAI